MLVWIQVGLLAETLSSNKELRTKWRLNTQPSNSFTSLLLAETEDLLQTRDATMGTSERETAAQKHAKLNAAGSVPTRTDTASGRHAETEHWIDGSTVTMETIRMIARVLLTV